MLRALFILAIVTDSAIAGYDSSSNAIQTTYALDTDSLVESAAFTCLRISQYSVMFFRAYNSDGNGRYDANVKENVQNAYSAGLGSEVYMTPSINSTKTGAQQFYDMYSNLQLNFNVKAIWIQVTSPVKWEPTVGKNIQFIDSIIQTAKTNGLQVGIYTNPYDWRQITNDWTGAAGTILWYWNNYGSGPMGESSSDFSDYHAFGSWTAPSAKQMGQVELVCGLTVNRDIVTAPSALEAFASLDDKIQIGGYVTSQISK